MDCDKTPGARGFRGRKEYLLAVVSLGVVSVVLGGSRRAGVWWALS